MTYSPGLPLQHGHLSRQPLGIFPLRAGVSSPYGFSRHPGPHPSGSCRLEVPQLVCPYNPARLTSGPARFPKTGSPHPTRFQSSVRGARAGRGVHRHRYFPVGGFSPPFRTRSMRGQGFPLPLPPLCHRLPRRPGALRPSRSCGRTTDTRRLAAGLSAAPAGHRQVGSDFPTHRRRGRLRPLGLRPLPTFGADSRAISGPTCPGRPSSYRSPIPRGLDCDRPQASQPAGPALSAAPAPISGRTRLPRQRQRCGGTAAASRTPGATPGSGRPNVRGGGEVAKKTAAAPLGRPPGTSFGLTNRLKTARNCVHSCGLFNFQPPHDRGGTLAT